ncbi:hypothetical protein CYMTET_48337 [Cymbomonas tetramitiformis]|uniref:Uncharacterized protein n=1 Tax=Cymbomonas tetramitiformis TaxID=36881 RepID=A0AAE0EVV1_9CHLO|nr:hypothetical protein CYMTET_48337 [Cymbomonas tetramitiformis]
MAAPLPDPTVADVRAAYTAPQVLQAVTAAVNFYNSVVTARIGRAKLLESTEQLILRLQPVAPAISVRIPLPEIPHLARLHLAGILVPEVATPSGFRLPIQWETGARAAAGAPVAAILDPAIQLLQTQLQKQAEDHAAALAAIQTQMTAQAAAHAADLAAAPARAAVVVMDPAIQLLLEELSKSVPVTEKWSLETLDVLAEVSLVHARRLSVLIVATGSTRFGVDPFETVRPAKMPLLVHFCRELLAEDPDTLVGPRATIELLQARVFLLKKTLVVAATVPERAMPAVGQLTMIPKTPAKAELYRQRESDIEAAVRGDPISEEAAQFSGGSMLTRLAPVAPLGGLHKGVDLRVRPFRTFAEDEEPRWELGLDGKSRLHLKTKCKTIEEWEQAFLHIAVECPSKEQGRVLLSFHAWFKLRISQFGFAVMLEFYDFLMKLVADSRADMSEHRVNTVWQEFQLLKSREGTDIYTPSSRVSPNPKAPKLPRVEPAPKPAALTKPPKFKGQCCWNFNKVSPPKRSSQDDVQAKVARRASPVRVALPADVAGVMPVPVAPHSFQKVWDETGQPCHDSSFVAGEVDIGPMPAPITTSRLWPPLLKKLWQDTTTVSLATAGTSVTQWQEFISELREAGASVPNMTTNACRMAAAFKTEPDKVFLVRGAACGVGFPFSSVPEDTFYTVENYVPAEHWEAMDKQIRKERAAGNVVMVEMEWNIQGISVVGVVAKERKGVIKFRPVWDYSWPEDVRVNSRIDLEKEKFSSIKDA